MTMAADDDTECKHGLPEFWCSWCSPNTTRDKRSPSGVVIASRFDGTCPGCLRPIKKLDPISLFDDEWLCEECW